MSGSSSGKGLGRGTKKGSNSLRLPKLVVPPQELEPGSSSPSTPSSPPLKLGRVVCLHITASTFESFEIQCANSDKFSELGSDDLYIWTIRRLDILRGADPSVISSDMLGKTLDHLGEMNLLNKRVLRHERELAIVLLSGLQATIESMIQRQQPLLLSDDIALLIRMFDELWIPESEIAFLAHICSPFQEDNQLKKLFLGPRLTPAIPLRVRILPSNSWNSIASASQSDDDVIVYRHASSEELDVWWGKFADGGEHAALRPASRYWRGHGSTAVPEPVYLFS
ncbi:hypothetical protein B0H66DRAFT_538443 [Apodospora peruviana]|uniref:Uncharacterized protein n=1 Tax=Apodospora peruviana TaxID=516989 RepID=A0AAE0HSM7_9PEZI|nr:hypothetical protein B0H66DRAFT_538443 [Apodospora peruviana]